MAHRTNVTQVGQDFSSEKNSGEMMQDPICGKKMQRKEVRHVLFRADQTYYFCSKECEAKFLSPKRAPRAA